MPNRAQTRRDPQKGKKEFSIRNGFTVIELMVVVAVIAIVASFALPSYRTIVEKRQLSSGAEQVTAFFSSAQMEAVKRNQFVAVNYQWNGGNWCLGMIAGDEDTVDCDCTDGSCLMDGQVRIFDSSNLTRQDILSSATLGDDDTIVFDPVRGLIVDAESAQLQMISPDQESYALNLDVVPTGRMNICSDKTRADHPVSGYEDC